MYEHQGIHQGLHLYSIDFLYEIDMGNPSES